MPRKPAIASSADRDAAPGGVAAVDRALSLLGAFRIGDGPLTLSELSERTGLYKSTALRLLASLDHARLVLRLPDGRYALGTEIARLHAIYAESFSMEPIVVPVLRELVRRTDESAAFYVRQGDKRLCLYRIDSPHPVRDHIRIGDVLPLDRGTAGRILLAYSGAKGVLFDRIRSERILMLSGDRVPELASISAPVFDAMGAVPGVLTLTMPAQRFVSAHAAHVMAAAQEITARFGGRPPPDSPRSVPAARQPRR